MDFFDADPKPTFSDVPASHWSFESVQRATDLGLLNGTGGGKFSPDKTMTYAEFAAMLTRAFYHNDVAAQGTGGQWYTPNINVAQAKGLLNGTRYASAGPNTIIDRYDMAMMIYNLQAQLGQLPSQAQISAAQGSIKDWSTVPAAYQQAVAASYATGMITGTGTGNFDGSKTMTRAEAATVLVRLLG